MKKMLHSKRVWIVALVFLLFAGGIVYADYTMPDGTVVRWVSGDTLKVIKPDGTSHITTGERNENGRLVPKDNSVDTNLAKELPKSNHAVRDGMNNTNMTVPIITDGQLSGWGDVYGDGHTYTNDTPVRNSNESQGSTVSWNPSHNNANGGGVVNITTNPHAQNTNQPTPPSNNNGGGSSNNNYTPPATPVPYVTSVTVSGPSSAVAGQTYSYTATASYSNGTTVEVTGSAFWTHGSSFTPQDEGTYTVSATYAGKTGSRQVQVELPPAAVPPENPPVRLY